MARSINMQYTAREAGFTRNIAGAEAAGTVAAETLIAVLALVGRPVTAGMAAARRGLAAWSLARKQRREDEQLWNLALTDARIMADLSRAMSQDALGDTRGSC